MKKKEADERGKGEEDEDRRRKDREKGIKER